ncbi:MAG TPA: hypothetical protein ENG89_01970, partial [Candidatus Moranbacteria bacterium]|nr:hypothetical protein [Candidatus Moranbacteria bacterium]
MEINFYSTLPFLVSLFALFLSSFVYLKQRKSPVNRAFSRFSIFTFVWLFAYSISYSTTNEQLAFFWLTIGYTGVILIPVGFYHFTYAFLNLELKSKSYKRILVFLYGACFLFIYFLYGTDYFVNGVYEYYWGYYPKAGFLHPYYLGFLFLTVGFCDFLFFISWLELKKEASLYRNKLQYIFLAFIIYTFAALDFIPNYGIEIYPFGWIFMVLFSSIVAYAILRYRLMDIRLIFKKTMAYSLSAGLLMAFFVVIVIAITNFISAFAHVDSFIVSIVAALIIALLFNPLRNKMQTLVDKIFYKKTYDYYSVIQKVSHYLASMFNIKRIYSFVGYTIFSVLGLKHIYILAAVPGGDYKVVYSRTFEKGKDKDKPTEEIIEEESKEIEGMEELKLNKSSWLIKTLSSGGKILIKDELPGVEEVLGQELIDDLEKEFEQFNGEAAVPIIVDDKLEILMVLGGKLSGDLFANEDVRLLDTVSYQTSIAVKNARLYSEKVHSERLASIGMLSGTFAHEIRNPLTSIKTFAQLIPEK